MGQKIIVDTEKRLAVGSVCVTDLKLINKAAAARNLGIDKSYLSLILAGKRRPSLRLALRIEALLGIGIEKLSENRNANREEPKDLGVHRPEGR